MTKLRLSVAGKLCPYRNIVYFSSLLLNTLNLHEVTIQAIVKIATMQAIILVIYLRVINQLEYHSHMRVLMALLLVIQMLSISITMEIVELGPELIRRLVDG